MQRRIDNPDQNIYANIELQHKRTSVATKLLLYSCPSEEFLNHYHKFLSKIITILGKPYYENNGFILYNMDMNNMIEALINSELYINLIVTSPPYNIGKEYEKIISTQEYISWCSTWMTNLYKATDNYGSFWLNLGYFNVENKGYCVPIPYLLWDKSPFYLQQEIVWKYGAGVSSKKRLAPRNEKWLFYTKDKTEYTFNLDDIRDPNVKYPNQKKNGKFRCNPLGKNPGDVWEFPKVTTGKHRSSRERTAHPAQFPLAVIERIILASSNEFDVVADIFAGSCSTGIAAVGLNRIFIGCEINKDYCKMAVDRYKNFCNDRNTLLNFIDAN